MITHVVLIKFKPEVSEKKFSVLEALLSSLPNEILEIKKYVFGLDVVRSERSYDFGLVAEFADLQSLECYQNHSEHQKVLSLLLELCEDIKTVDFSTP